MSKARVNKKKEPKQRITCLVKLRVNKKTEIELNRWLYHLASVYNWAIKKIELNAQDKIYFNSSKSFQNLLAGCSSKLEIPSHTIQGTLITAFDAWGRCFKKLSGKPKLKSIRNKLNSIPFPDVLRTGKINKIQGNKITLPSLGAIRFHKQDIPNGDIKSARLIKRAGGWHLCLFIEASRETILRTNDSEVGIDPGFKDLLTLSNGIKINRPKELANSANRLAKAQRGINRKLTAKLHLKIKNQRKDRNHKLSLKLVQENAVIAFSKDNHQAIAKRFGKSVSNAAHYQLQQMLEYKSRAGGTKYIEVDSRNSTKTCSCCGVINSDIKGLAGLSVRQWECKDCGSLHDRDINAARNTLIAGVGATLEELRYAA